MKEIIETGNRREGRGGLKGELFSWFHTRTTITAISMNNATQSKPKSDPQSQSSSSITAPMNNVTSNKVTKLGTGNPKWDAMYDRLVEYRDKHQNCLVPNRYKEMPQLGSWVSTQRRHYKMLQAGKDSPLTQERLDLLTRVGFVWATRDPRHVS